MEREIKDGNPITAKEVIIKGGKVRPINITEIKTEELAQKVLLGIEKEVKRSVKVLKYLIKGPLAEKINRVNEASKELSTNLLYEKEIRPIDLEAKQKFELSVVFREIREKLKVCTKITISLKL